MAHRQLFKATAVRNFASVPATKSAESRVSLPKKEPKITTLPNGLVIASHENYSPTSKVSVVCKAGSRYEKGATRGINHILRNTVGQATKNASAFGIHHQMQLIGATLKCTSSREHISYSVDCNREHLDTALEYLTEVGTGNQLFLEWEMKEVVYPRIRYDLAALKLNPGAEMMDNLHKAAYRTGLGNSIFCPDFKVGKIEEPVLQLFVNQHFTPNRMAVIGVGVEHDTLVKALSNISGGGGPGAETTATTYGGGEVRVESLSPITYAAIATEGISFTKPKEAIALSILQHIVGVGPRIKRSVGASKLSAAVAKVTQNPAVVSSLNVSYSDSGLFGFCVAATSEEIGKALQAAIGVINSCAKSGGITDQDVKNAKNKLKADLYMNMEIKEEQVADFELHAMINKQIVATSEIDKLIDGVTTADVASVAKKVLNGKPSMSAVGNLVHTPYLDQLIK